jgi:hypothetical protein
MRRPHWRWWGGGLILITMVLLGRCGSGIIVEKVCDFVTLPKYCLSFRVLIVRERMEGAH